ncbi:MAG: hypothetical protein HFE75_01395 [Firmicutes bacterium]|nr:hypothetical protein [Bacillota bacterium]
MLEPCEGKLSCTVLRGEGGSNTADLLDQILETKQKYISQIMTSRSVARTCEEVDDATLSFAEVKALAAGNPAIKEKMELDVEVSKLTTLKNEHVNMKHRLENDIHKQYPKEILRCQKELEGLKKDLEKAKIEVEKPFEGEAELAKKMERLSELNLLLSAEMDKSQSEIPNEEGMDAAEDVLEVETDMAETALAITETGERGRKRRQAFHR